METRRKKRTKRQKNLFNMTVGAFVIVVTNNYVFKRQYVNDII